MSFFGGRGAADIIAGVGKKLGRTPNGYHAEIFFIMFGYQYLG